jgi:hypothetical protein
MSNDGLELLKRENAELRDQLARAQEEKPATADLDHPDFEGFREMSRALHEGRYHQWYTDKHMFPGAYNIIAVVVVLGLVIGWGYLLYTGATLGEQGEWLAQTASSRIVPPSDLR